MRKIIWLFKSWFVIFERIHFRTKKPGPEITSEVISFFAHNFSALTTGSLTLMRDLFAHRLSVGVDLGFCRGPFGFFNPGFRILVIIRD